jgi:hypothetical protein
MEQPTILQAVSVLNDGVKTTTSWNGFTSAVDKLHENGFNWADMLAAIVNGASFVYHASSTVQGLADLLARIWDALTTPAQVKQPATAINYAEIFQQQRARQRNLIYVRRPDRGFGN